MNKISTPTKPRSVRLLVGGKWADGAGTAPLYDKYTGEQVAEIAIADEAIVNRAIAALDDAFRPADPGRPCRGTGKSFRTG